MANVVGGPCCGDTWEVPWNVITFKWHRKRWCYRWSEIRRRWIYSHDVFVVFEQEQRNER